MHKAQISITGNCLGIEPQNCTLFVRADRQDIGSYKRQMPGDSMKERFTALLVVMHAQQPFPADWRIASVGNERSGRQRLKLAGGPLTPR